MVLSARPIHQDKEKAEAGIVKTKDMLIALEEGAVNDKQRLQAVKDEVSSQQARLTRVGGKRPLVNYPRDPRFQLSLAP